MVTRTCYLVVCIVAVIASGCTGSRWARKDPVYREKYPVHSDNVFQTMKQAVDARHLADRAGGTLFFTYSDDPTTLGIHGGAFKFPKSWLELHGSIDGLAGTANENIFVGGTAGVRVQAPGRIAPFAGIGGQVGIRVWDLLEDDDSLFMDDDDDEFVAAFFPEIGVHFWTNESCRITTSVRYASTLSSSSEELGDQWIFGIGFSRLFNAYHPVGNVVFDEE